MGENNNPNEANVNAAPATGAPNSVDPHQGKSQGDPFSGGVHAAGLRRQH